MPINPMTGMEEDDDLTKILSQYDTDSSALKEAQSGYDTSGAIQGALASLGAAFQGKDSIAAANQAMNQRREMRKDETSALDKWKQGKIQELGAKRDFAKADREANLLQQSDDPNSSDSLAYQQQISGLFPGIGKTIQGKSKTQIEAMMPLLTAKIRGEQERENARIAAGTKADEVRRKEAMLDEKQVGSITDLDNAQSDLNNLLSQLGDKSDWTGPGDGRVPDMFVGDDQVAWRSALGRYKDAYRKAVTGAGAGDAEVARLEGRLPSELDTLANFRAKAKEALGEISRRRGTLLGNYGKMGKDVSKYGGGDAKTIVKTQTNQKTGDKRIVYSDGTTEIVSAKTAGR